MQRYGIIMAGGTGSRLWPLSRTARPKQFIETGEGRSMLEQTIDRLLKIIPAKNCFVITNNTLAEITRETVKGLIPESNIILEPARKNTAACIAYGTFYLKELYGRGLVCFVPADGYVKDNTEYEKALTLAFETAESFSGIVIIGVTPTYPATGYGYIKVNSDPKKHVSKVYGFLEKPDKKKAQDMISTGGYLWNGGIVAGDMDVITQNVKKHLPGHYEKMSEALSHFDEPDFNTRISNAYAFLADISFDYGVLEKSDTLYAVKGFFDWDDIGSLDALAKTLMQDENGNSVKGMHLGLDTEHSAILSEDMLTVTIGLSDMIVAATKDAVIVCPRDRAQEVRQLVEKLKLNGLDQYI